MILEKGRRRKYVAQRDEIAYKEIEVTIRDSDKMEIC